MAVNKPEKVIYKCESCGSGFEVPQGSRRRYCPKCLVERVTGQKHKKE